ncbi:MAG: hypothetical protein ACREBJ_06465 [Nitrosotalea sp.]
MIDFDLASPKILGSATMTEGDNDDFGTRTTLVLCVVFRALGISCTSTTTPAFNKLGLLLMISSVVGNGTKTK